MTPQTMQDKVCLVTGANSGIGKATAQSLTERGAQVIMVCRNAERGEQARAEIQQKTGSDRLDLIIADLAVLDDVRTLAQTVLDRYDRLDVLVNNAGVLLHRRQLTPDGYEASFAINHLAHFLLTHLLLGRIKASTPARIINVSSDAHRGRTIAFDDLQAEKSYGVMDAYGQSKLANVLFTYALARRLEGTGVVTNVLHPGVVGTRIGKGGPIGLLFRAFGRFMLSPNQGAATTLYLATHTDAATHNGQYFVKQKAVRSTRVSYDEALQERLWSVSAEMTGVSWP